MPRKTTKARSVDRLYINAVCTNGGAVNILPFLDHPGTAVCICLNKEQDVLVVKQYRPVIGRMLIELPGGVIRVGETPKKAAIRETFEETGIRPSRLECLGSFFLSVGLTNEVVHVYFARVFSGAAQAEKNLSVLWLPLSRLTQMVQDNRIEDAKTALAVTLVERRWGKHVP